MQQEVKPILKWAGGKRALLKDILPMVPKEYGDYYEPFIGGGAVFLNLKPHKAFINDMNGELINVYIQIKEHPNELIEDLKRHQISHSKSYYYEVREKDRLPEYKRMSPIQKASRTIYLNRTCYNGLYRVNSKGYFNTPIGRYINPKICDEDLILSLSKHFNDTDVEMTIGDYKDCLKSLKMGDFVYFDPPYDPLSKTASFTSYTKDGFDFNDQIELKKLCDKLDSIGVKFLMSNSCTNEIKNLYSNYKMKTINVRRMIGNSRESREMIEELLIYNY